MPQTSQPELWRQRLQQRLRECVLTLRDNPADSQSQVQEIQLLVARLRAPSDSEFARSRAQLSSEDTTPNINIPFSLPVQEASVDRDSGRRQLRLPQWPITALQSTNRTQMRSINLETGPIRNSVLEREEMRLNLPRERPPPMPPMFSLSVSRGPTQQWVPDSNMRRVSPPDSLPSLISDR